MNTDIVIVCNGDDWEGLYIDGKIVVQDHKLRVEDVLAALGIYAETVTCDPDWLLDFGYLPNNLDDVVLDEQS